MEPPKRQAKRAAALEPGRQTRPRAKGCPQPAFIIECYGNTARPIPPCTLSGCFPSGGAASDAIRLPKPKALLSGPLWKLSAKPVLDNQPRCPRKGLYLPFVLDIPSVTELSQVTRAHTRTVVVDSGDRGAGPKCHKEVGGISSHVWSLFHGASQDP